MILLFSSNINGGVLQLAVQLLQEMNNRGIDCYCLIPKGSVVTIPSEFLPKVEFYNKIRTVNKKNKDIGCLVDQILIKKPNAIWYVDSTILSAQLCCRLSGKIVQFFSIHDPVKKHPSNNISFKQKIISSYKKIIEEKGMINADKIILFSNESYNAFIKKRKKYKEKVNVIVLGAHIPHVKGRRPKEYGEISKHFFLFFGRIDKYKGLSNILRAYELLDIPKIPLIIAGKGNLTKEEQVLASGKGIFLINRYIEDEEMVWLFENAAATVLPYIEASQSGIIPISYKFGVPVITSDVKGLSQFVVEYKTGFICSNELDYVNALKVIQNDEVRKKMAENAKRYYENNMEWERSLKSLL